MAWKRKMENYTFHTPGSGSAIFEILSVENWHYRPRSTLTMP